MGSNNTSFFSHQKLTATILFCFFILSVIITALPLFTMEYISFRASVFLMLVVEFLVAIGLYFFVLRHYAQYKITFILNGKSIKKALLLFLLILIIQVSIFIYKNNLYHYKAISQDLVSVITLMVIIPFYEEVFYRGCLFGVACSVFKKNIIIPGVITSVLFCLMHTQYYSIPDQLVLFSLSSILIYIRVETRSLSYPILIHSGMNAFVIFLNAQGFYR